MMSKLNTPIVVVAYNRPRSLSRVLGSLQKGNYPTDNIDLIISIDNGKNNESVLAIANDFKWQFGTKKVIYQEKNLGLRAHILKCGSISETYGSVIVLEDDFFVAANFYNYSQEALKFTKDKPYVGGISLYNHQFNVHTGDNFLAMEDGYDNWYFQFASSWGQVWSKDHWNGFMEWYKNEPKINENIEIPKYVRSWSEKSWLKYNIAYLIDSNLYFLYPKISLSTNFSDAGTHVGEDSTLYQVPLDYANQKTYFFSSLEESTSVYDAFYENKRLANALNLNAANLTVDLYGYKQELYAKKYLLSSKILDFKIIKSFGKSLKPMDANIFENIVGSELFLYDCKIIEKNYNKADFKRRLSYNIKKISFKDALTYVKTEAGRKINVGIQRIVGRK